MKKTSETSKKSPSPSSSAFASEKRDSWKMFNRLAKKYDLANRVLSLGMDHGWRLRAAKYLPEKEKLCIIDVATGTGDFIIAFEKYNDRVERFIGVDLAPQMLEIAAKKFLQYPDIYPKASLRLADAQDMPFKDGMADVVSMGFGIRNVPNTLLGLKELHRILKKGGKAMILEFALPRNIIHRFLFLFYLRVMVPLLGFVVSGDFRSYYYLTKTVAEFPSNDEFMNLMKEVGFHQCEQHVFFPGGISLYCGYKP